MDPKLYLVCNQLLKLTGIEEMFIARVYAVTSAHRLSKENIGYEGNTLNVQQDMQLVLTKLPLLPSNLPVFVAHQFNPNSPSRCKDFIINRERTLR